MKKIVFLLLFAVGLASFAQAQTVQTLTSVYTNTSDTVVNTAVKTLTTPQLRGYYKAVDISVFCTKISGTVGGTATLQASIDGTNFYNVPGQSAITLTDLATQCVGFHITDASIKYLRVSFAGAATMSNIVTAKVYAIKTTP